MIPDREKNTSRKNDNKHIDISRQTLEAICNGNAKRFTIEQLYDIANFLDVSVSYLLGLDECSTPDLETVHNLTGLCEDSITFIRDRKHESAWIIDYLATECPKSFDKFLQRVIKTLYFDSIKKLSENKNLLEGINELVLNDIFNSENIELYDIYSSATVVHITEQITNIKNQLDYLDYGEKCSQHSLDADYGQSRNEDFNAHLNMINVFGQAIDNRKRQSK